MSLPAPSQPFQAQQAARAAARLGWDPWFVAILCIAALVACHTASRQSIVHAEAGHLAAGLAYWQHGRFDIYPHNPPLVKLWAALPMLASGATVKSAWIGRYKAERGEVFLAHTFVHAHSARVEAFLLGARLAIVGLYLLGAWMVGRWASSLFGQAAGRAATLLWCFNPLVLAHGTLATVDIGPAVAGLAACRAYTRWLQAPGWRASFWAGGLLGLALASKFTMLVLLALFPLLAVLAQLGEPLAWRACIRRLAQLVLVYATALLVLSATYGFQGLGRSWTDHDFFSSAFRHAEQIASMPGGTLALNALAGVVPFEYLRGLDLQWLDVEKGYPAPFLGEVRRGGRWYYYPFGLALKVPACFWLALLWAVPRAGSMLRTARSEGECLVLAPLALYGVFQANPSVAFLRYVLPAMPFVCVLASACVMGAPGRAWIGRWVGHCLVAGAVAACLWQHPHYIGYVNVWAGGPARAWRYFSDSDIDWGQDLQALRHWQQAHPQARPMRLALYTIYAPPYPGLVDDTPVVPGNPERSSPFWLDRAPREPHAGYLAISVTLLNAVAAQGDFEYPNERARDFCRWLRARPPLALVGTSILIYHFSARDVEEWRAARRPTRT